MGALLSLPLLALPSMGTVRHALNPFHLRLQRSDLLYRFSHSAQAVVVLQHVQQYVVRVGNAAIGRLGQS